MFVERLLAAVSGFCDLSASQAKALERHYEMLVKWTGVLNLTAVRDEQGIVERHYGESLFLGSRLPGGDISIADLGSGAGFPGVPVAVLHGASRVVLIESHLRKAVFLRESTRAMRNVRVAASRAESVNESFDWVISRAVKLDAMGLVVARLGRRVAVFTGRGGIEGFADFEWETPVRLPWGDDRFLWLGRNIRADDRS